MESFYKKGRRKQNVLDRKKNVNATPAIVLIEGHLVQADHGCAMGSYITYRCEPIYGTL